MYTGVWVHDPMGINGSRMYDPRNMYAHNCSGLKTDEHCTVSCGPGYEVYNGVNMPRVGACRWWRQTVPLWNAIALTNQLAFPHPIATISGIWASVVLSARRATP